MKKIAYIAPYTAIPSKLASSVHIMKMCDAYIKTGFVGISLFVSDGKSAKSDTEIFNDYQIDNIFKIHRSFFSNNSVFRWIYFFLVLPVVVKLKGFDIVHTRNLSVAYGCSVLFRIPTILELHDSPGSNSRTLSIFNRCINSRNLKVLIVITKALEDHILKIASSVKSKITVLPDGVSENNLLFNSSKEEERRSLDISQKYVCVYTGHLYKGRGIDFIIQLAKSAPEIGFYLIGGNDENVNSYRKECIELSNIFFLGFMNQEFVMKYQKAADILLMPYENNVMVSGTRGNSTAPFASPLKMFEYMATGRPIISSQLPVLYEILNDGVNSIMLPYGDVPGWSQAIRKLTMNPEFAQKLADRAKSDVSNLTWEKRALKITNRIWN